MLAIWPISILTFGPISDFVKTLTKKHPLKKESKFEFWRFYEHKKMRDVRTIIFAAESRRDLCYVSENEGFRFLILLPIIHYPLSTTCYVKSMPFM